MTTETLDLIWERFTRKTWGEKFINKELKNSGNIDNINPPIRFLGSVEQHKKCFFEAVKEFINE